MQRPSFKRREGSFHSASFYSKQTLWKIFSQPRLRLRLLRFTSWHVQFGTSRLFGICLRNILPSHGLMLVRDSMSRCTSDRILTVTCYNQLKGTRWQLLTKIFSSPESFEAELYSELLLQERLDENPKHSSFSWHVLCKASEFSGAKTYIS